jgi:DNA-binding HxlR family transcriptional regulator
MKLVKVTDMEESRRRRWYDDACGTALALELVGERWALMVVRELMFGPRRFSEIRCALPGLSANVLTQRLDGLEQSRVLAKRRLPPPGNAQVYELTPWGYQSERAIQELGRWAVRSPEHDTTLPLSAASMMMSLRTMYDPVRAAGIDATIGFRIGADHFRARLDAEGLAIRRDTADGADLVLEGAATTLAAIVYGGRPIADAEAAGELTVDGDRALAERFVTLFVLPPKWDAAA